jgi:hypothetical protein
MQEKLRFLVWMSMPRLSLLLSRSRMVSTKPGHDSDPCGIKSAS